MKALIEDVRTNHLIGEVRSSSCDRIILHPNPINLLDTLEIVTVCNILIIKSIWYDSKHVNEDIVHFFIRKLL